MAKNVNIKEILRPYDVKPFQWEFLTSGKRYPAFIAGWGTGKTMFGIFKGLLLSQKYPNNVGLIVRRQFVDLRDSTMRDFTRYTEIELSPIKPDVILANGSRIMFRHADQLAGIKKNINLGWFMIEQAEEFDTADDFDELRGRLRLEGVLHQGFIVGNTNGHNWIWRRWKFEPPSDEYHLVEATSFDNKTNLPIDTIKDWEKLQKERPTFYNRFVMNSWEDMETADRCIPYELITNAIDKNLIFLYQPRRVIGCDVADMGDDLTVIYVLEEGKVIDKKVFYRKEPMATAGEIMYLYRLYDIDLVVVDSVGIGAGVRSRCSQLGMKTLGVNVGEKADESTLYKRRKAEIWMNARHWFEEGKVSIPNDDDKLIEELAAITYTFNSRKQIVIDPKQQAKKVLGRSPDHADAFVLALWGLQKLPQGQAAFPLIGKTNIAESYSIKTVL